MSEAATVSADTQVSIEQDGRVLTGLGPTSEALTDHMDRRTPDEPTASGAATDSQPTAAPGPVAAPAEPQTRGRQRFSDLTKERDAARAETTTERTKREAIEREVVELRAKVQQASTPQQAAQAQQQLTQAEDKQQAQPVNGQKFQFPAYEVALESYPELVYTDWEMARLEAFGQWKDAQFDARLQARFEADRSQRSINEQAENVWTKGRAVYKDFEQMRTSGPGASVHLGKNDAETAERNSYVLRHPRSEHIAHKIFSDGELARKLQQSSALEFGSLIAELAPPTQQSAPSHVAPPAPFQPVGSGSSTTSTPSSDLAKKGFDFDASGYREKRAAERGLRRAR